MTNSVIRIQLVDDHAVVRSGFRHLLENEGNMRVVAESENGEQAISDYERHEPDIIVMDIAMPGMGGMAAMRRILTDNPDAQVILLSMLASDAATRAMEAGARGFLSKKSAAQELIEAIRKVMRGEIYIDSDTAKRIALNSFSGITHSLDCLAPREYEIMMQIVSGNAVEQIAATFHISPKTVRSHKSHIMEKLGATNMVELIRLAIKTGMIEGA